MWGRSGSWVGNTVAGLTLGRVWLFQDFVAGSGPGLTLSSNGNGTGLLFDGARVVDSSAVATKTTGEPIFSNTAELPSQIVSVSAHSGTSVTLDSTPAVGEGVVRIWYLYAMPAASIPTDAEIAPRFVKEERSQFLDTRFLNASLNLSDISLASAARTNLGLGTVAVQAATSGTSILKGDGSGGFANAVADTDYQLPTLSRIGVSTYSTVQHLMNFALSPGVSSGGTISDAGGATFNVAAGTGFIKATDSNVATVSYFDWAASNGNAISSNTTKYVGIKYNAGSPVVDVRATDVWDLDTEFPLGVVVNEGGTLYISNIPWVTADNTANVIERFDAAQPVSRDGRTGGLILANSGTRNVSVSAGALLGRMSEFTFSAFNTASAGSFDAYFRDGAGGFTKQSAQTQWNNTQYDDNSGSLQTMTTLFYTSRWFYVMTDGSVAMVYGASQYASIAALLGTDSSAPASVPARIQKMGMLIGRFIIQKSASTPDRTETSFGTQFAPAQVQSASDLSNGVTGSGAIVLTTSPTIVTPTIAKLANLTSNGYIKTSGGDGTLGIQAVPIPVADGGTGQTSYTNGQLLIGNTTGNTLTKATLTASTGITILNSTGSITISAPGANIKSGTVTLSSATTSKAVAFATTFGSTNYSVFATLENTTDTDPVHVAVLGIAKSNTGFTIEWGDSLPTANYVLNWIIVGFYDP